MSILLLPSGVGITDQFTKYKTGQNVFQSDTSRWITSNAVFTLGINIYNTGFISWRMWQVGSENCAVRR
ncbi:hypothetical protein R3P38DRAFT_3067634 [Favolaschia claudopus]|uniref:Uncharacterized protein n=1 Tax=Favolaschia claudopus TaxID=2862362 RepID=A0AAW0A0P6_9AGAR